MKTDCAEIDQILIGIFGKQFVDRRVDVNPRSATYSHLQGILIDRKDKRYLAGLFQGLRFCDVITQKEWRGLMNRFVKAEDL
jgi:hypothetical protein